MFFFSIGFCNFFIYSFNMTWPHIFICSFHLEFFFLYVYNCHWVIDLYLFIKAGSLYHWFIWPSLPSPTSCFIYDHTVNSQNIISYNHTGNTVLFQLGSAATSYVGRPYSYSLASSWHHIYTLLQVNLSLFYVCIYTYPWNMFSATTRETSTYTHLQLNISVWNWPGFDGLLWTFKG